jgi:hypothetical protein
MTYIALFQDQQSMVGITSGSDKGERGEEKAKLE